MAMAISSDLILTKADAATLVLHPLVLINISDHFTRQKVSLKSPNPRVLGALLGQQCAKSVELFHSFELLYCEDAEGKISLDVEFLRARKAQFKQTFENLDVIGWYSTGSEVTAVEAAVQRQLLSETDGEANIFLLVDALAAMSASRDLPISTFEAEVKLNADQTTSFYFSRMPFRVDTGDSERVAVDHVAQARPFSEDESPTVAHLTRQQNAIRMLRERILSVKRYLEAVDSGEIKDIDYSLLRQIHNLIAMLPTMSTSDFKTEMLTEFNDSLLQTYLATVTKGSNDVNNLVDHYNTAFDRQSRIGMRFGGGFSAIAMGGMH